MHRRKAIADDFSLIELRNELGLVQAEMARRMGLSLRPYQELELNSDNVRPRHVRLAESVALDVAVEKKDPELAPVSVRNKAIGLVQLMLAQHIAEIVLADEG